MSTGFLKGLELRGKVLLGAVAAGLFWRPWRPRALPPGRPIKKVLLVRLDNRVGEIVLMTGVIRAARSLPGSPQVDVLVHPKMVSLMAWSPEVNEVIAAPASIRGLGLASPQLRALRSRGYDLVVNCTSWEAASIAPSLVARIVAKGAVLVGPRVWPVNWLADVPVPPLPGVRSEARQRANLLSPLGATVDDARVALPAPEADPTVRAFVTSLQGTPFVVINPGGRLASRRAPTALFVRLAQRVAARGWVPVITWGPGEEPLAAELVAGCPAAVVAPATTLRQWAALTAQAARVLCNNTGPMHLSVALGTPTFALFWEMDMARWGHHHPPHVMRDVSPGRGADDAQVVAAFDAFLAG